MGWIDIKDKYPPEGLHVLVEASGWFSGGYGLMADHSFYLGCWIIPKGETEGHWILHDSSEDGSHLVDPEVHAWMPLPKHFEPNKIFGQEEDLMEHSFCEDDPDYLYKGDCVYEQMSLEEFLGGGQT